MLARKHAHESSGYLHLLLWPAWQWYLFGGHFVSCFSEAATVLLCKKMQKASARSFWGEAVPSCISNGITLPLITPNLEPPHSSTVQLQLPESKRLASKPPQPDGPPLPIKSFKLLVLQPSLHRFSSLHLCIAIAIAIAITTTPTALYNRPHSPICLAGAFTIRMN